MKCKFCNCIFQNVNDRKFQLPYQFPFMNQLQAFRNFGSLNAASTNERTPDSHDNNESRDSEGANGFNNEVRALNEMHITTMSWSTRICKWFSFYQRRSCDLRLAYWFDLSVKNADFFNGHTVLYSRDGTMWYNHTIHHSVWQIFALMTGSVRGEVLQNGSLGISVIFPAYTLLACGKHFIAL